jgi:hypothetical protein
MDSVNDTPKGWVAPFGHPRIKACSRLPVAFRSVPRPSSPPGAKASTECPSLARDLETHLAMRPSPCTETILSHQHPMPSDQKNPRYRKIARINHHKTPGANAKNRSAMDHSSLSTQHSPLNTRPRQRDANPPPSSLTRPPRKTPTIRSDLLPQRAQRRTRT